MRNFVATIETVLENGGREYILSKLGKEDLSIGQLAKHLSTDDLECIIANDDVLETMSWNDWDSILEYTWECQVERLDWSAEVRLCQLTDNVFVVTLWSQEAGYDCTHVITHDEMSEYLESQDFDDNGYEDWSIHEKYMVCYALVSGDGPSGHDKIAIGKLYTRQ